MEFTFHGQKEPYSIVRHMRSTLGSNPACDEMTSAAEVSQKKPVKVASNGNNSWNMFLVSLRMHIFRVSQQDEIAGLDEVKHKEKAYEFGE